MNVVFDLAVNLEYTKLNTPLQQFRMKVVAGRFDLCYWSKGPPLRLRYIFFKLNTPLQQFRMKVVAGRFDLCYWSKGPPLRLRYIFFVSLTNQHVLYTAPVYLKVKVGNDQEMAQ